MFDLEALNLNTASEKTASMQVFKRDTILDNALDAAKQLIEQNPNADLSELRATVAQFAETASQWQPKSAPDSLIKRAKEIITSAPIP